MCQWKREQQSFHAGSIGVLCYIVIVWLYAVMME